VAELVTIIFLIPHSRSRIPLTRFIQTNKLSHVTPDIAADPLPLPEKRIPPAAGMTTKVVKGSMWTLGGSVLPLAVSFISTPFIIRFLGSEAYGVLILVGLIPAYFSFADFGMSVASTKFAAEAYGEGDEKREVEFVSTATAIAAVSALMVAVPLFLFSYPIVRALNVPEHFLPPASIALKITSVSFVLGILASVLNSPMLGRLRMDMNMFTAAVPKILLAAVTPLILYFGGHIVGAVSWALLVSAGTLFVVVYFSGKLLPGLLTPVFNRDLVRPLVRMGGAWFIAIVAGVLIGQLEKFLVTSLLSVKALAYYSIAFTFANVATLFSQAMLQPLLPAFSQLMTEDKRPQLDLLFARGNRLAITAVLPITAFLVAIGNPFLTIWAGEEFGIHGSAPFYILITGFLVGMVSVLSYCALLAAGRTDQFARMYWFELPVYGLLCWYLIGRFGVAGAAIAYASRTVFDALWASILCRRLLGLKFGVRKYLFPLTLGTIILAPIPLIVMFDNWSVWLPVVQVLSLSAYAFLAWKQLLDSSEKVWLLTRVRKFTHG
jgi:O-antigen/teichoic acid export membrane protein